MNVGSLMKKAAERRLDVLDMVYRAKTGHIGGSLSSVDMLCAIYYNFLNIDPKKPLSEQPDRDRFIFSKGHSVEGYYAVLADAGFFPKEKLKAFSAFKTDLIGHPNRKVPGMEFCTGALGHGLSLGVGVALAAKKAGKNYKVYVMMGDGELAEGSIYEAAMSASHYKLDNLIVIIDRNRLQISGETEKVMSLEPLAEKWRAFGFSVKEIDGNYMPEIIGALDAANNNTGAPSLIIANTVKGRGVSFMENNAKWHHGNLNEEQYNIARVDLEKCLEGF